LQIARDFAGFTYAEADILRKAVGKKIKSLLDEQKNKFINGVIEKKNIDPKVAAAVW
jgi:DNA polymerase-3 subunit alpha